MGDSLTVKRYALNVVSLGSIPSLPEIIYRLKFYVWTYKYVLFSVIV